MKPRAALLLLIVGVLALAGGWYFGVRSTPAARERSAAGELAFPGLAPRLQQAARLEIVHAGKTLTIERHGDVWGVADRFDYPVQPGKLHAVLSGLTELRLTERRTTDSGEFSRLGVEDAQAPTASSTLLRVLDAQGQAIAALIVGHQRIRGGTNLPPQIYVRRPGEDQAWLAEGTLQVDADPQLWFDRDLVNIEQSRIAEVAITRGEQHLQLTSQGGKLAVTAPDGLPKLDENKLDDVGHGLEFLSFTDVKPAAQIPGEPLGKSVFTTTDGLVLTVDVNQAGKDIWVHFTASGKDAAKAQADQLTARLAAWCYQVGDYKRAALVPSLDDLKAAPPVVTPIPGAPGTPAPSPAPAPAQ
ncbi:MAG: DUF4340 domain-containing protein [Acidisphaera sp.]|nr:DUF4340 domain-containing protein [Acidisphaera sp.]